MRIRTPYEALASSTSSICGASSGNCLMKFTDDISVICLSRDRSGTPPAGCCGGPQPRLSALARRPTASNLPTAEQRWWLKATEAREVPPGPLLQTQPQNRRGRLGDLRGKFSVRDQVNAAPPRHVSSSLPTKHLCRLTNCSKWSRDELVSPKGRSHEDTEAAKRSTVILRLL